MKESALKLLEQRRQIEKAVIDGGAKTLLLPQAVEIENALLGSLLRYSKGLEEVEEFLLPTHFSYYPNQQIYGVIIALDKANSHIDKHTVGALLTKQLNGEQEYVAIHLQVLLEEDYVPGILENYGRIIQELSIKREFITQCIVSAQIALQDITDPIDVLDQHEQGLFKITNLMKQSHVKSIESLVNESTSRILHLRSLGLTLTGVPSGFRGLDRITSGWQKTDLIIIAARPGMGKTTAILQLGINSASKGFPVGIFSLEMSADQLTNRAISNSTQIEYDKLKSANLSDIEVGLLEMGYNIKKLKETNLYIDDTPSLSLMELRAKARRLVSKFGVKLIIVDYLQLMTSQGTNREQEVANLSRGLKGIAKSLNVPIIAISSLSRSCELRADKRPMLSDLRESGAIESDADIVIFLYRDEYYKITSDPDGNPTLGVCEWIIAKHRNGALDTIRTKFIGKYLRMSDFEEG